MTTNEEANRLLDRIGDALRERGVTLDELIEEGREERGAIFAANYGLAEGYQSVPALTEPKTDEEITEIVADERAERYRGARLIACIASGLPVNHAAPDFREQPQPSRPRDGRGAVPAPQA